jgi:hypothetical protein
VELDKEVLCERNRTITVKLDKLSEKQDKLSNDERIINWTSKKILIKVDKIKI